MAINESKKSIWHVQIFRYVPLILWIGIILFASTTQASMSNTSRFIRPILEFLFPNTPDVILLVYHGYVRKLAHLTEYAILAFLASRAFWLSGKELLKKYWHLFAMIFVLLVASIDEFNQSFDATRTGSIYDVLLDGFGGAVMILFILIVSYFWKKP